MQNRLTLNEYYLAIAKTVALRSSCLKKHYGAIIVNNNYVCSTGYNGVAAHEAHCENCTKTSSAKTFENYCNSCQSIHAEMNALLRASKEEMIGATLYLAGINAETGEEINAYPCEICLRLIKNAGINRVINKTGIIYERNENGILERKF